MPSNFPKYVLTDNSTDLARLTALTTAGFIPVDATAFYHPPTGETVIVSRSEAGRSGSDIRFVTPDPDAWGHGIGSCKAAVVAAARVLIDANQALRFA